MSEPMSAAEVRRRKIESLSEARDVAHQLEQIEQAKQTVEKFARSDGDPADGNAVRISLVSREGSLIIDARGVMPLAVEQQPGAADLGSILRDLLTAEQERLAERFDALTAGVQLWRPESE